MYCGNKTDIEAEEEKITLNIKLEEAKRPKITKEFIIFTLNKFRNLDLRFEKNKERLIDGLVKAIFVYDDYIKLILTFDDKPINIPTSDEIENMANSSDIQSSASPKTKRADTQVSALFVFSCSQKKEIEESSNEWQPEWPSEPRLPTSVERGDRFPSRSSNVTNPNYFVNRNWFGFIFYYNYSS